MNSETPQVPVQRRAGEPVGRRELVVVGVDGSRSSVRALIWALRYAVEHDAAVEIVTAWPLHAPVFVREVPGHFNEARWDAVQAQSRAVAHARSLVSPHPEHTTRLENADPLEVLVRAAERASLLVLGTDRADGAGAGSWTSLTVRAQHAAPCQVILVPDAPDDEPSEGAPARGTHASAAG